MDVENALNADDPRLSEYERVHLKSRFFQQHLLCGHPSWSEGRLPSPKETPHLTTRIDDHDTFIELTWSCTVCSVSETATLTNIEEWRQLVASLLRDASYH